jgi:hypothetical protein
MEVYNANFPADVNNPAFHISGPCNGTIQRLLQ